MPDLPPESLTRITSNGSSIISGGSDPDIELHRVHARADGPTDDAGDAPMTDAPAPSEPPPDPSTNPETPPPPPPQAQPTASPSRDERSNDSAEQKKEDDDGFRWVPIFEDSTPPGVDELKRLESAGEINALDYKYWEKKAFKDLEDPDYVPLASGRIEWTVDSFNGTQDKPSKELLRYSEPVKIGDYHWRIKLYPKGNGTSYIAAYVECVDFMDKQASSSSEDFDEDDEAIKKERFTNEVLDSPMPTIGKEPIRKPLQVPAQMMIVMYNLQEPRVHSYKRSSHSFTPADPDRGFSRFGPCPIYDLGLRAPETRQAMLRNDTLSFVAYVRLFRDPTGFLFIKDEYDYRRDFARTGLRPIKTPADSRGYATNLAAAIVTWSLLPSMRTLIYRGSNYDLSKMPLTKALQEFLAHWRRQPPDDFDAPTIAPAPLEQVAKALHWHGSCHSSKSCHDPSHLHGTTELGPDNAKLVLRKLWHPAGKGMQDFDVFQAWEFLLEALDSEWRGTEMSGALQKFFEPSGFRSRLSPKSNNVQSSMFYKMMKNGQRALPPMLQVELPRSVFDEERRKWRKTDDKIIIGNTLKLSKEESGWYQLYAIVLHDGALSSRQYTPLVRPDGRSWYKVTTLRANRVFRVTEKQVMSESETRAYIAIYLRADMVQHNNANPADPFKGFPENDWHVPEYLTMDEKPKAPRCSCSKCREEREEARESESQERNAGAAGGANEATSQGQSQPQSTDASGGESASQEADAQDEKQTDAFQVEDAEQVDAIVKDSSTAMYTDENDSEEVNSEVHELDYFTTGYYRGTLHKGYMHGNGRRIYATGDVYEGEFNRGSRHGHGQQIYQNGDSYEGAWDDDKPHGNGTRTTASTGNVYHGGFKKGRPYGEFTLTGNKAETLQSCLICYERERDAVFYPCGHMCACLECGRKLEDCPYCHRSISESIQLYAI